MTKLAKPASRMTKKELVAELCLALHERNEAVKQLAEAELSRDSWKREAELNQQAADESAEYARRLAEAEALLRVMPGYGLSAYDKERWEKARNAFLAADSAPHRENDSHD